MAPCLFGMLCCWRHLIAHKKRSHFIAFLLNEPQSFDLTHEGTFFVGEDSSPLRRSIEDVVCFVCFRSNALRKTSAHVVEVVKLCLQPFRDVSVM